MRTIYYILCLAAVCLTSCRHRHYIGGIERAPLCATVMWIDSVNRVIISQYADSIPYVVDPETGVVFSEEQIRDAWLVASRSWKRFVHHVRTNKYQKASQFLLEADTREGILGHLRESELRCMFILNVVKEMLQEYQPDNYQKGYLEWLYSEVLTELNINGIPNGQPNNVAPSFPNLILDYGLNLSEAGFKENALELLPFYQAANQYFYPDDQVWVQVLQTFMESSIYHLLGDTLTRDSIVANFKDNMLTQYGNNDKMLDYISTLENHFKYMDKSNTR